MVKWSKIIDHDHGQNFKIAVIKWSKFVIFDHDHGQHFRLLWSNGQNWSIRQLTTAKLQGVMVIANFFDY